MEKDYWKDFTPIWWEEIKSWFGWTDWLNAMMKTGVQLGSVFLVFFFGGNAESFLDSVLVKVAEWILTILLLQFVLTITYLRASRKLYSKQKYAHQEQTTKNSRLRKLTQTQTIKTTQIEFGQSAENPFYEEEDKYHIVYLEIKNGEDYDLRNCFVNLESLFIRDGSNEEWVDWLKYSTRNTTYLTWVNFGKDDEKIIRRKKSEKIMIARMRPKDYPHHAIPLVPHVVFADGTEERLLFAFINIQVSLNGELSKNGKLVLIDEVVFNGFLKREQGIHTNEGVTYTEIIRGVPVQKTEPLIKTPYFRLWIEPGEI